MGFFGWHHILYIVLSTVATIVGLVLIKKYCKTEKAKRITYLSISISLLLLILANRISVTIINPLGWRNMIPSSICIIVSTIIALAVIFIRNKNHPIFHGIILMVILGSILTVAVPAAVTPGDPNYTGTVFEVRSIFSLIYHSVSLFLAILLIVMLDHKPDWRKLWMLAIGYLVIIAWALFCVQVAGIPNAAGIERPLLEGTPFYWWAVGLMYLGIVLSILVPIELIGNYIRKRRSKQDLVVKNEA